MRIIEFRGGLGNQLFEYAHYLYLKNKYPNEIFFGYYPGRELWCHQGLEIHKRFEVELPESSRVTDIVGWILFTCYRKPFIRKCVDWMHLVSTDKFVREDAILHEGYWQDKKYFGRDFKFEYKADQCNKLTNNLTKELKSCDYTPVSIHVRRGDYLTCDCPQDFAGICTPQYYENAISYIFNHVNNPHFFFFSDDPEFVKANFTLPRMTIVDWNKGENSWQDMYLMSQCKAMILANSTFSFWGAQNNHNNPIVLCPNKWNNKNNPDLAMPGWIEIKSV